MDKLTEIDPFIFNELKMDMGKDFIIEMVDAFCEDSKEQAQALMEALDDHQQADFTRAAHTLKSTSLIFGAKNFSDFARELEQLGREERLNESNEKVETLIKSLKELQIVLKDFCNG